MCHLIWISFVFWSVDFCSSRSVITWNYQMGHMCISHLLYFILFFKMFLNEELSIYSTHSFSLCGRGNCDWVCKSSVWLEYLLNQLLVVLWGECTSYCLFVLNLENDQLATDYFIQWCWHIQGSGGSYCYNV